MYLGRSLVLLWYLGAWYAPALLKQAHAKAAAANPEQMFLPFTVASPKAYTRGLLWKIAQAQIPWATASFSSPTGPARRTIRTTLTRRRTSCAARSIS
jgi:hypothetical protein